MKPIRVHALLAALLGLSMTFSAQAADAPAAAPAASGSVAKVNGVSVPQSRLDFVLNARAAQGQPTTPDQKDALAKRLIEHEAIAQEAAKQGLEKNPDVANQMELARQQILVQAYAQEYAKTHPIPEERVKAEYDKAKAQAPDKEYKARHILVAKEADAKDIIKQLKKGAKFEKLAEKSMDTVSKARGGELDWSPATNYVKPFADALASLKKGELTSTPVKTDFGWHVIQLQDVRATQFPPYEEAKPIIQRNLQQQQVEAHLADVVAKAKVER